jgi:hypothetical protein
VKFIQKEATHAFINGERDQEVEQHLLMCSDMSLNKALKEAQKLEMVEVAARPPARL